MKNDETLRRRLRYCGDCGHGAYDHTAARGCWGCHCTNGRRDCEVSAVIGWAATTFQQPESVDMVARALAGLATDEDWPGNEALGGGLTGTRDDEYRDAMLDEARTALYATLGALYATIGAA